MLRCLLVTWGLEGLSGQKQPCQLQQQQQWVTAVHLLIIHSAMLQQRKWASMQGSRGGSHGSGDGARVTGRSMAEMSCTEAGGARTT